MLPEKRHYLPAGFGNLTINVLLVGCGGNGAQMLMGLASLDTALRAISSRSLHVTVADDDIVTEANLGRQPIYRCDIDGSATEQDGASSSGALSSASSGKYSSTVGSRIWLWGAGLPGLPMRYWPSLARLPRSSQ